MKKNIAIIILAVISIFSLLYGYTERIRSATLVELGTQCQTEADRQRQIAEQAIRNAEVAQRMAQVSLVEAEKQRQLVEEQLKKLKRK